MSDASFDRRRFLKTTTTGAAGLAALAGCDELPPGAPTGNRPRKAVASGPIVRTDYKGPRVIVVRFGGGVRRLETIWSPEKTYCPFIYHELARKQGILFRNVEIASQPGVVTSHGQGTLYILTGHYHHYEDILDRPFADRFEPVVPTLFEYFRRHFEVPEYQTLIVNGEDRINEEFYTFSNHHQYGARYRSTVLSLYRFKTYLLREELKRADLGDADWAAKEKQLAGMESKDYRVRDASVESPQLDAFWDEWRQYYGRTGLVNPRGDRLLTTLGLWAIRKLKPRLMMINYQDPDYVHWGNPQFYTRAISIIDEGVGELYNAAQADEEYRDNTVFVIVPDCGRDNNLAMSVPYQHHFNSHCAHEIFAIVAGPRQLGVPHAARPLDRLMQQASVAATVGELMGFPATEADEGPLFEKA